MEGGREGWKEGSTTEFRTDSIFPVPTLRWFLGGWVGWFKHGLAISLAHFSCIRPLVNAMQNFIKIRRKLLSHRDCFGGGLGGSSGRNFSIGSFFKVDFYDKAPQKVSVR